MLRKSRSAATLRQAVAKVRDKPMLVMTRQIKAARSLLGWEQHKLARHSGIAISTIRRLEGAKGTSIRAHFETIDRLRIAIEKAGIEFIGNPWPGVRLRGIFAETGESDALG